MQQMQRRCEQAETTQRVEIAAVRDREERRARRQRGECRRCEPVRDDRVPGSRARGDGGDEPRGEGRGGEQGARGSFESIGRAARVEQIAGAGMRWTPGDGAPAAITSTL